MVESSAIEPDSKVSSPFQTSPRARSPTCSAAPNFLSDRAASTEIDGSECSAFDSCPTHRWTS